MFSCWLKDCKKCVKYFQYIEEKLMVAAVNVFEFPVIGVCSPIDSESDAVRNEPRKVNIDAMVI